VDDAPDPWTIVDSLTRWASETEWCDWLELAGSLGRGAGDEWSDVDAGLGVDLDGATYLDRRDAVLDAAREFADVGDTLIQRLGSEARPADHLVVQYRDGRQLGVVVFAADHRPGLPPEACALLDRSGRLAKPYLPPVTKATDEQRREWAFLGWWGLSDVAKHARRGNVWRALESLAETRTHAWRLYAADVGVVYPIFGAVSVENAGIPAPEGMSRTLAVADTSSIMDAAREMAEVLEPLAAGLDVSGVRSEAYRRLFSVGRGRTG
jgi:hypothetical protein